MSLAILAQWCALSADASVIIITDEAQNDLAKKIARDIPNPCTIMHYEKRMPRLKKLRPHDLVIALLSFDTFMQGACCTFSPFGKPKGLKAKYAFIRLGISEESLLQGLSTPKELVYDKIAELHKFKSGSKLRVTNPAGTDITLTIDGFGTYSHEIIADGGIAFLPPSETSAEVKSADGVIAVDVTVGQLYYNETLLGQFGLVKEPVMITVKNGVVIDIAGNDELKQKLFALPSECRKLEELGHGLSDMQPTGLIGVDESIIHTCHFGIGDGGNCGVHLDVVASQPAIVEI